MAQALTLMEAAERLAPVFDEPAFSPPATVERNGDLVSLEHAGAILSERMAGRPPAVRRERVELTLSEAAKQIEGAQLDAPAAALSEIREKRLAATANKLERLNELQLFASRAHLPFDGVDDQTALASPEFAIVYGTLQSLQASYEAAIREEFELWEKQRVAEGEIFDANRPNWGRPDAERVAAMLAELGVSERDIIQLWFTPYPVNIDSPACLALAQMVTDAEPAIPAALESVGFSADEISAVTEGAAPILLRDHRIQELVARAADEYAKRENSAAA